MVWVANLTKDQALRGEISAEISAIDLPDMQVYSLNEAAVIGRVKDAVIDARDKRLLALAVDKGGWYHDVRVIPAGKIHTIGDDVITVDEKQPPKQPVNLPRIVEYMRRPCNLVGAHIVSDDGRALGRVEGFYLDRQTGDITRLEIAGGVFSWLWAGKIAVPAQYIQTLGEDSVVVDAAALSDLRVSAGLLKVNFAAVAELAEHGGENVNRLRQRAAQSLKALQEKRRREREQTAAEVLPGNAEELPVNL